MKALYIISGVCDIYLMSYFFLRGDFGMGMIWGLLLILNIFNCSFTDWS